MRIATYTRISTDEEHQPYSLEAQRERLGAYAKSQEDWRIVRRFTDQASGAGLERPGLEQALQEAQVGFRSASEPFDTTNSAGRMMVQMLGVFAEFERATIVERVVAGMERKAARGEWNGGSVPFGYQLDAERRFLIPDAAEAPLVAEIFASYAERLQGAQTIARRLSEDGNRTKQGKPFNAQA